MKLSNTYLFESDKLLKMTIVDNWSESNWSL